MAEIEKSGYQSIVTFDPMTGFRGYPSSGTGAAGSDELLRALDLMPANGIARGGVDLLAIT